MDYNPELDAQIEADRRRETELHAAAAPLVKLCVSPELATSTAALWREGLQVVAGVVEWAQRATVADAAIDRTISECIAGDVPHDTLNQFGGLGDMGLGLLLEQTGRAFTDPEQLAQLGTVVSEYGSGIHTHDADLFPAEQTDNNR